MNYFHREYFTIFILLVVGAMCFKVEANEALSPSSKAMNNEANLPSVKDHLKEDKRLPGNKNIPNLPHYSNDKGDVDKKIRNTRNAIDSLIKQANLFSGKGNSPKINKPDKGKRAKNDESASPTQKSNSRENKSKDKVSMKMSAPSRTSQPSRDLEKNNDGVFIFTNNLKKTETQNEMISLPSGSSAMGTLMAGLELAKKKEYVNIKLDSLFAGPNSSYVELKECHIWVQMKPQFNKRRIESVTMHNNKNGKEKSKISCRNPDGSTFENPISVQIRDATDEYVGVVAEMNTRNMEVAAAWEFTDNITKGFGKAFKAAQIEQTVTSGGPNTSPQRATNVTGNDLAFAAGNSIAEASGTFIQNLSDFFWDLRPTLAVSPGTRVIVTIKEGTKIPKKFYKKKDGERTFIFNTN